MVRPVDVVGYPTPKNKDILLALIPKPLWTPIFFLLNLISLSKRVPEAIKTFGPFLLASGLLILIREYHKPLVGIKIPNSFLGTSAQARFVPNCFSDFVAENFVRCNATK
jgi:hypothetical protein